MNDIVTQLFNSPGWKAVERMGSLASMHHIFSQNYSDLNILIIKIQNDRNVSQEIYQEAQQHLDQYVFNFLSSPMALVDNCRSIMSYYNNTILYQEYQEKVNQKFLKCPLHSFIKQFRNFQTHFRLCPISSIRVGEGKEWKTVLFCEDLLKYPNQWNILAKQYIEKCGQEINIKDAFSEYNNLIDNFYHWLYGKLKEFHKDEILERNRLIEETGINIPGLVFKI